MRMQKRLVDRWVLGVVLSFLVGLTWVTLSIIDNHEKWDKCNWPPHEFEYEKEYNSKKWGVADLFTCKNCGFQFIRLRGVSTNGETENVMAIKSLFSNDFDEYYIEYYEPFTRPKYIKVKEEKIMQIKGIR